MASQFGKRGDIESGTSGTSGNGQLYPSMMENPQLRWGFIRKVYVILTIQLLLTVAVAAVVVSFPQVSHFVVATKPGLVLYIFLLIMPFLLLFPLYYYHQKHPVNLILLGLFTVCMALIVGVSCSFRHGKVVLEAAILTAAVVISLTLYTFWAAKRGHDFSFLGPFLFAATLVLVIFSFIQFLFPLGKISVMIFAGLSAVLFSGYIIYDTDNLIKRFSYDDYIWAVVSLYLDIINLFVALLTLLDGADS